MGSHNSKEQQQQQQQQRQEEERCMFTGAPLFDWSVVLSEEEAWSETPPEIIHQVVSEVATSNRFFSFNHAAAPTSFSRWYSAAPQPTSERAEALRWVHERATVALAARCGVAPSKYALVAYIAVVAAYRGECDEVLLRFLDWALLLQPRSPGPDTAAITGAKAMPVGLLRWHMKYFAANLGTYGADVQTRIADACVRRMHRLGNAERVEMLRLLVGDRADLAGAEALIRAARAPEEIEVLGCWLYGGGAAASIDVRTRFVIHVFTIFREEADVYELLCALNRKDSSAALRCTVDLLLMRRVGNVGAVDVLLATVAQRLQRRLQCPTVDAQLADYTWLSMTTSDPYLGMVALLTDVELLRWAPAGSDAESANVARWAAGMSAQQSRESARECARVLQQKLTAAGWPGDLLAVAAQLRALGAAEHADAFAWLHKLEPPPAIDLAAFD